MAKMAKMIIVLTLISFAAGLALGGLNAVTKKPIEENVLKFKKVPAVLDICAGFMGELSDSDRAALEKELLEGRKEIEVEGMKEKVTFFPVKKDGALHSVVLESSGQGYGGAVGTMVGISLDGTTISGVGITTHSETPGIGSLCTEAGFRSQFMGLSTEANLGVKKDGGVVDAISGATVTSRAVSAAIQDAVKFFKENEAAIKQATGQ